MEVLAGKAVTDPEEAERLIAEGWENCRNQLCHYWISPEEVEELYQTNANFDCPLCHMSYPWWDVAPFGNLNQETGVSQGIGKDVRYDLYPDRDRTWVGLPPMDQGDIGENLLREYGHLPEYGEFTWWADESYNDPIDAGIGEWGVEIKSIVVDAKNHKFVIGDKWRREAVIQRAVELGFTKLLGVLVMMDFRTSTADIYAREFDLEEWTTQGGRKVKGPVNFDKSTAPKLLESIPFESPFLDPDDPAPYVVSPEIPF